MMNHDVNFGIMQDLDSSKIILLCYDLFLTLYLHGYDALGLGTFLILF